MPPAWVGPTGCKAEPAGPRSSSRPGAKSTWYPGYVYCRWSIPAAAVLGSLGHRVGSPEPAVDDFLGNDPHRGIGVLGYAGE